MESDDKFLMFKARAYGWLETELTMLKVEYDYVTHQKRELAEVRQQAQHYQRRTMQLNQELTEERQRRMMCEEQVAMITDMYEQQSDEQTIMQQQIAILQRELTECTRLAEEERDKYVTLHESSLANGQELDRVKVALDELSNIAATATAAQLELFAANEKVAALERENEILTNDLNQNKARIVQLETKIQESSTSGSVIISGLAGEENANILQKVTNLAKALLETVEQGDRSPASDEPGAALIKSARISDDVENEATPSETEQRDDASDSASQGSVGKLEELEKYINKRCTLANLIGCELATGIESDCIKAIAFKIARGELEMLLVAELYVLLQEICSAITRKNAMLGRNVSSLANSMTKCWKLITDARVMMNREFMNHTIRQTTWKRH